MKCPLLTMMGHTTEPGLAPLYFDCLKEECAWWDNTNGNCAVLQLSKSVFYAGLHIAQAEKKMPHEGQSRT